MVGHTFIDIFSGAGGSTLGFVKAGFSLIGALDNFEYAVETFKRYFKHEPILADARMFDYNRWGRELGDVDVVVGCPPCQGFSRMRNCKTPGSCIDSRNDLVFVYVRVVKELKPKAFVFENVGWMIRAYGGIYLNELLVRLKKLGYRITWGILDARDYGVPQRRRRLIIIGSLRGEPRLPEPTYGNPRSREVKEGMRKPWRTVRDAIADLPPLGPGEEHPLIPNHKTMQLPEHWLKLIKAIPKDGGSRKDVPSELWLPCHRRHKGHNDVFGRLAWDKPANTITTGCWNPSKGRFVHPEQDRGLSLRECARLQGFPDDFIFYGPATAVAIQIGNALPPPLAQAIAEKVKELL